MKPNDEHPEMRSAEALLRFLDTVPSGARRSPDPAVHEGAEAPRSRACPGPDRYMDLVLGATADAESDALLEHAACCERCAFVLAGSLRAIEGNPTADEVAAITALVEGPGWQQRLAAEMAETGARKRPFPGLAGGGSGWRSLAAGVAAAALLAAAGGAIWQRHASAPESLLAKAYQQSRTLDLRIPEAGYANLTAGTHTRGAGSEDEPAPLLEARAGLARKLQAAPEDGHWLELEARAEVLGEHYDRAVEVLDRLLAQGPVTAELLTDAATAYYQRGLISNRELDRSTALEYLRRADEMAPTDPVVLFNEAVVMQDRRQMMNAVEVWNRYLTVERDTSWAAEGKRRLAALEAALQRLKSHEGRVERMLATPEAMNALAGDGGKLAAFDEELSTLKLVRLTDAAFPAARGSPCDDRCQAARRLLQATGESLKQHHADEWLSDLLDVPFAAPLRSNFSETDGNEYAQAMRLLGRAAYEIQSGVPATGKEYARQAHALFRELLQRSGWNAAMRRAMGAGADRSAVEYLYGLQRVTDFRGCMAFAREWRGEPEFGAVGERYPTRYPWIAGMALAIEHVCENAPEQRVARLGIGARALQIAEKAGYPELRARVKARQAGESLNDGDDEIYMHETIAVLDDLLASDSSPNRFANTFSGLPYAEIDASRPRVAEMDFEELVKLTETAQMPLMASQSRFSAAQLEMRRGAIREAKLELGRAYAETPDEGRKPKSVVWSETEMWMARAMLETGDVNGAGEYLDKTSAALAGSSDTWLLRQYTEARGQLLLTQGKYDAAERVLTADLESLETEKANKGGSAAAEYAELDHDLYAELAAVWLGQGRPAAQVLALWERFRRRARGIAIPSCAEHRLDCEAGLVEAEAQRQGGGRVVVGQILLLDRVLLYRVDGGGVRWSAKPIRRESVLDAAQKFELAISSPTTRMAQAAAQGAPLSEMLLPELPQTVDGMGELVLEPDPKLEGLSWPVLPTDGGPLGLRYGLAESASMLEPARERRPGADVGEERALVVGASIAGNGQTPLPEALSEARKVSGFLRTGFPQAPVVLLGQQATTEKLAQAIGTATVFHFAGHATGSRDGTELLLAPESQREARPWVDGAFLRQHPPRACRLAVLSACGSGKHEASWKDPLQNMVEALHQAGVPAVVATRWEVDSEASVPMMDAFYGSLARGSSVAWALTTARRVQSTNSAYANPYYWGAYYVFGGKSMTTRRVLHGRAGEEAN